MGLDTACEPLSQPLFHNEGSVSKYVKNQFQTYNDNLLDIIDVHEHNNLNVLSSNPISTLQVWL